MIIILGIVFYLLYFVAWRLAGFEVAVLAALGGIAAMEVMNKR